MEAGEVRSGRRARREQSDPGGAVGDSEDQGAVPAVLREAATGSWDESHGLAGMRAWQVESQWEQLGVCGAAPRREPGLRQSALAASWAQRGQGGQSSASDRPRQEARSPSQSLGAQVRARVFWAWPAAAQPPPAPRNHPPLPGGRAWGGPRGPGQKGLWAGSWRGPWAAGAQTRSRAESRADAGWRSGRRGGGPGRSGGGSGGRDWSSAGLPWEVGVQRWEWSGAVAVQRGWDRGAPLAPCRRGRASRAAPGPGQSCLFSLRLRRVKRRGGP